MVLKVWRRRRFMCNHVNMTVQPARPVNKEQGNNIDRGRCDITFYSRCHDAARS